MKINKLYLILVALLAFVMSSCTDDLKYAKMIPADASFVMRLDVKQAVEKCELQENANVKKSLKDALKESEMSQDMRNRIEQIFEKPATSGLDLRQPLFFYGTTDGAKQDFGIVGALHSESDFAELLNALAKEADAKKVEETDESVSYMSFGSSCIVFNDDWFYIGDNESSKNAATFANDVAKKLDQHEAKSFVDSEAFKKMGASGGVMQILVNGEGIANIASGSELRQINKAFPEGVKLEDAAYMFDLTMDNGEMALTGEFLSLSDKWKEYIKKGDDKLGDIKGDLLKYVSNDGLTFVANINGKQILDELKKANLIEDANDTEAAEKILPSIEGDLAINITDVMVKEQVPFGSVYVQTKDNALVSILEQLSGGSAKKVNENEFLLQAPKPGSTEQDQLNVCYGYKNNASYLTIGESTTAFNTPANALSMNDLQGKKLYLRLGFAILEKLANREAETPEETEIVKKLVKICDFAELYYEGGGKVVLRLVTKDKAKSPAASLIDLAYDVYDTINNRILRYQPDYNSTDKDFAQKNSTEEETDFN